MHSILSVWSSPGGSAKVFLYDEIKLTWYADNNSMIFKGVNSQILGRLVISTLETGVLLTNVLSNGDRELNASNIENCDKDKVESYFKDCS